MLMITFLDNVWTNVIVDQPMAIDRYNRYMNGVDHSDHLIGTNNVMRKCLRWWKTLFFHLIDIAIVNGFIPFQEHQANFPDSKDLRRPPGTWSVILGGGYRVNLWVL